MSSFFGHLNTINKHKYEVFKNCVRCGLIRQGILHDLSKYSPVEFFTGVKYYAGFESPNSVERRKTGKSKAWLHHKGRNKHHFEYWIDYAVNSDTPKMEGMKMPYAYVAEMFCDRVAASKVYKGKDYDDSCPYVYYLRVKNFDMIHPETKEELESLLILLKDKGEKYTFSHLKRIIKEKRKNKTLYK